MPDNSSELETLYDNMEERGAEQDATPTVLNDYFFNLWWHWADFSLYVITPTIEAISPPIIIPPEPIVGGEDLEFVYSIHDYGYKLMTSKAEDMFVAGMSMCRLYLTIEKMIYLLIERLKSCGASSSTEVQIAFSGHLFAQRKAFESVINLGYNVIVTNFEPGDWGDHYLETVKRLSDKGYGYPSETPRDNYRHPRGVAPGMKQ